MKINVDKYISWVISLQYILIAIQSMIQLFIPASSPLKIIVSLLFKFTIAFLMLLVLDKVLKRKFLFIISTYIIFIVYILLNILIFQENINFILDIQFDFLLMCLTSFVYVYSIGNYRYLLSSLYFSSFIVSIYVILYYILKFNILNQGGYDIYFSYLIVFAIILNFDKFMKKKNFILPVLILSNLIILLLVGSRGGLLCIIVYLLLSLLKAKIKLWLKLITILLITFFYLNHKSLLSLLNEYLNSIGLHSRTLWSLSRDTVSISGRDIIYENTIVEIKDNLLFGIGLAGDRLIHGTYSHNIILEIFVTFGILVGTVLIILLVFIIFYSIFFAGNLHLQNLSLIYFSYAIPMLMVSRTFWTQVEFWVLLAICIKAILGNSKIRDKKARMECTNS